VLVHPAAIISLLVGAWPALKGFGLKFIFTAEWTRSPTQYGAWFPSSHLGHFGHRPIDRSAGQFRHRLVR